MPGRSSARRIFPSAPMVLALFAALAGALGIAAVWTVINVRTHDINGWMAIVAAIDAIFLMRIAGLGQGWLRAAIGTFSLLLAVALAGFLTAATILGQYLGLQPLESAQRLSIGLAWSLASGYGTWLDLGLIAMGVAMAWLGSR